MAKLSPEQKMVWSAVFGAVYAVHWDANYQFEDDDNEWRDQAIHDATMASGDAVMNLANKVVGSYQDTSAVSNWAREMGHDQGCQDALDKVVKRDENG